MAGLRGFVIGADENLAPGNHGTAVSTRAEACRPLDVPGSLHVPIGRDGSVQAVAMLRPGVPPSIGQAVGTVVVRPIFSWHCGIGTPAVADDRCRKQRNRNDSGQHPPEGAARLHEKPRGERRPTGATRGPIPRLLLPNRIQLLLGRNVQDAVDHDGRALDRSAHFDLLGGLLLLAVLEDQDIAVLGAQVNLVVHPVGRAPDGATCRSCVQ